MICLCVWSSIHVCQTACGIMMMNHPSFVMCLSCWRGCVHSGNGRCYSSQAFIHELAPQPAPSVPVFRCGKLPKHVKCTLHFNSSSAPYMCLVQFCGRGTASPLVATSSVNACCADNCKGATAGVAHNVVTVWGVPGTTHPLHWTCHSGLPKTCIFAQTVTC